MFIEILLWIAIGLVVFILILFPVLIVCTYKEFNDNTWIEYLFLTILIYIIIIIGIFAILEKMEILEV